MTEKDMLSPPTTSASRTFRESVHLIPTPGVDQPRPPPYDPFQLRLWVIGPVGIFMIALGIGLEVALFLSQRNDGFAVPERNVFSFASEQFLTSFFPILFVVPLGLLWQSNTWFVKTYQPYLNLARGTYDAEDTILLDYAAETNFVAAYVAYRRRHFLVLAMTLAALATLLMQPLAGSIFSIRQVARSQDSTATSIRTIGLDPDRFQLNAFVSASGFVQAAVANNLTDPPFVNKNWTTADFVFDSRADNLNGTMLVNTTGIRTNVGCAAPATIDIEQPSATLFQISATSRDGCAVNATFDPSSATQQYGVTNVPCSTSASLNITFQPVFFWFFHENVRTAAPEPAGVFCAPFIELFWVQAFADLTSGELLKVNPITKITADNWPNNVTSSPQNGLAFNGVIFELGVDNFTDARAVATRAGVSGAIFQSIKLNGREQAAFNAIDGFVDTTTRLYQQHLSLVAKNTYMIPTVENVPSILTALRPRLAIEPLPGHALSIILILIGLTGLTVGYLHSRARRSFFLAAPPGTIASAVSLTSHSGFGQLLYPYDTTESMVHKLHGLGFHLDERTGAILTYDQFGEPTDVGGVDSGVSAGGGVAALLGLGGSRSRSSKRSTLVRKETGTPPSEKEGAAAAGDAAHPLMSAGYSYEAFAPPPVTPPPGNVPARS